MHRNPWELVKTKIGMPREHVVAIRQVAMNQSCVIIFRAPGLVCQQLLEEGYDTKGYRIHSKSCDWGPMAGFVMRDPRLNKSGLVTKNLQSTITALEDLPNKDRTTQGWNADFTHLKISSTRIDYLVASKELGISFKVINKAGVTEGAVNKHGFSFDFALFKEPGDTVWGLYCNWNRKPAGKPAGRSQSLPPGASRTLPDSAVPTRRPSLSTLESAADSSPPAGPYSRERSLMPDRAARGRAPPAPLQGYEKMFALTNPPGHRSRQKDHYLNAVTGDYDLFAVWPLVKDYDPEGADSRPLPTVGGGSAEEIKATEKSSNHFTLVKKEDGSYTTQASKMADPTPRIYLVAQMVNSVVPSQINMRVGATPTMSGGQVPEAAAHPARNVIWHSDESANPHTSGIDLPLIAFMPDGTFFVVTTIPEFKELIYRCKFERIKITLAANWIGNDPPKKLLQAGGNIRPETMTHPSPQMPVIVPEWFNR